MKQLFILLVLSLTAGCGPSEMSAATSMRSKADPDLCFPGLGPAKECFGLIERKNIDEQPEFYRYANPYTSPSFPKNFTKEQYLTPEHLVDVRTVAAATFLTRHFRRHELMDGNSTRGHFALFSPRAASRLEDLRQDIGQALNVTSAYRSPGRNQAVGGAEWSRHVYGDGVDLVAEKMSHKQLKARCELHGASYTQLYVDHVHCDWRNLALDPALFPVNEGPGRMGFRNEWAQKVQELARIVKRPSLEQSSTFVLETDVLKEDGEDLLHEWTVIDPQGAIIESSETNLRLPNRPGRYFIKVLVGGNVELQTEITQPGFP